MVKSFDQHNHNSWWQSESFSYSSKCLKGLVLFRFIPMEEIVSWEWKRNGDNKWPTFWIILFLFFVVLFFPISVSLNLPHPNLQWNWFTIDRRSEMELIIININSNDNDDDNSWYDNVYFELPSSSW